MYIETAEFNSIEFRKHLKSLSVSINYESRENPENITGILILQKSLLSDDEWAVSDILAWIDKNQRYEIITGLYAPSLKDQLKDMILEKLHQTKTA